MQDENKVLSNKDIDNLDKDSEGNTPSADTANKSVEDTDNKSSEKAKFDVWKEYKKLKKEVKKLKTLLIEENQDEDSKQDEKQEIKEDNIDEIKFELFLLKNPEAQTYKQEIKETLKKFPGISFDDALAFSKVHYPKSKNKTDFTTTSATPKKELKDFTKEEILKTGNNKKILEWARLKGIYKD